jgi:orotate phosphoribosyltransferase
MFDRPILEMSPQELLQLQPEETLRSLTTEEVVHIFRGLKAFWMNERAWEKPHVKLTSGMHSNGYINCRLVFGHENLRHILAYQMARAILDRHTDLTIFRRDWVVGSDTSATELAGDLARVFNCRHGIMEKGPDKEQFWRGERVDGKLIDQRIGQDERVLHIEELMTTAFTAERVINGIISAHGNAIRFYDFIPVLMHRSQVRDVLGRHVHDVNHFDIDNWDKEDCPYCKNGSPLVENPKENWALLT